MEMEFFVEPGTDEEWHEYWLQERWHWYVGLGLREENLRFYEHPQEKLSFSPSGPSTSSTGSASAAPNSRSSKASRTAPTST